MKAFKYLIAILLPLFLFVQPAVAGNATTADLIGLGLDPNIAEVLGSEAVIKGDLIPAADDTYDLGSPTVEWQDIYADGTITTDVLTVDTTSTFTGNATFVGNILCSVDNTCDLGTTTTELKDGFFDGTLASDVIRVDTTIDADTAGGAEIGVNTPFATINAGNGTIKTYIAYSAGNSTGVVGTTTNHPLEFRTNGTEVMRLSTSGIIDFKGTYGDSTIDPSATAETDWLEIKLNGTQYFIPLYPGS